MPSGQLRQRADAAARAQRLWTMRVAGATWSEAAGACGYHDAPSALRAVKRYFGTLPEPDRDELRATWRARLELLWRQSAADVEEQRPGAVRSAVAVAQRAAALDALDQPVVSVTITPTAQEFEQVVGALVARAQAGQAIEADIFAAE